MMMHRFFTRILFKRILTRKYTDDCEWLSDLLLLYKDETRFHNIYKPRQGRDLFLPFWYMNADQYLMAIRSWEVSMKNADEITLELEGDYYADLDPRRLYSWLRDNDGHVIPFDRLLGDAVKHGRVLVVWLDALAERDDQDALYGIRKTRKLTRDTCEILTLALSLYTGVP